VKYHKYSYENNGKVVTNLMITFLLTCSLMVGCMGLRPQLVYSRVLVMQLHGSETDSPRAQESSSSLSSSSSISSKKPLSELLDVNPRYEMKQDFTVVRNNIAGVKNDGFHENPSKSRSMKFTGPKQGFPMRWWKKEDEIERQNYDEASASPPSGGIISNLSKRFTDSDQKFSDTKTTHYTVPATTIESLRQRFGEREGLWGGWSCGETRRFYRQQLPYSLRIDGALGLSLEERAVLAAEARHALRMYARERCILPGRVLAGLYDGLRHMAVYGTWASGGLTWEELKHKYTQEAYATLGDSADDELVALFVYGRIVDKACMTNPLFDNLNDSSETDANTYVILLDTLQEALVKTGKRGKRGEDRNNGDKRQRQEHERASDGVDTVAELVGIALITLGMGRRPHSLSGSVMHGYFDDVVNLPDKFM